MIPTSRICVRREGDTVAVTLHGELRERFHRFLLRRARLPPAFPPGTDRHHTAAAAAGVRKVTGWITRNPDRVSDDDRQKPKVILARCPELEAATGQSRSFAAMTAIRSADRLPAWIATARTDKSHGLRAFADGLVTDLDAVALGLSTDGSSGGVEGRVTDIKA